MLVLSSTVSEFYDWSKGNRKAINIILASFNALMAHCLSYSTSGYIDYLERPWGLENDLVTVRCVSINLGAELHFLIAIVRRHIMVSSILQIKMTACCQVKEQER